MRAVIHQVPGRRGAGLFPIAGRPLIARQVQWLRAVGCERVAIEVDSTPESGSIAEWIEEDGASAFVDLILTPRPVGPEEVARRAAIPPGAPFLAIPANVLGSGDLTLLYTHAGEHGVEATLTPLDGGPPAGVVRLFGPVPGPPRRTGGPGWGAELRDLSDAHAVGVAALEGHLPDGAGHPITIHAASLSPGVFVGRGAHVHAEAVLRSPVLIGPGAHVGAGAVVGPGVCVGANVLIHPLARLTNAEVADGSVVAEGQVAADVAISPRGSRPLLAGRLTISRAPAPRTSLAAPPSGGQRVSPASPIARALAFVLAVALGPLAAVALLAPRRSCLRAPAKAFAALLELARGERALVGVSAELMPVTGSGAAPTLLDMSGASAALLVDAARAPVGLVDISNSLFDANADDVTRLRAIAWYGEMKSARLDAQLLARRVFARSSTPSY